MGTLLKIVRIAYSKGQDLERAVYSFLADYRLTPHSTTGVLPSAICISRKVEDVIPHHAWWEDQPTPEVAPPETRQARNRRVSHQCRSRFPGYRWETRSWYETDILVANFVCHSNRRAGLSPVFKELWSPLLEDRRGLPGMYHISRRSFEGSRLGK